jgi:hypothetical protein
MRERSLSSFFPEMLQSNEVEQVEIRTVERAPSLQRRSNSPHLARLSDQARKTYKESRVTFWDELMRLAESEPSVVRREVFAQALYHRDETEGQVDTWSATRQFLQDLTQGTYEALPDRQIVALTSRVRIRQSDKELHIPMIDFRLDSGPSHDEFARELVDTLAMPGYLVDSGNSYHFYGRKPIGCAEFRRFLGRAQLMSHYADQRWIGHQLISGKAALRISSGLDGEPPSPRLVARI